MQRIDICTLVGMFWFVFAKGSSSLSYPAEGVSGVCVRAALCGDNKQLNYSIDIPFDLPRQTKIMDNLLVLVNYIRLGWR